jgi:hypothetical protein
VECGDGLVLVVRTPGGGSLAEVELEFSQVDATPVRESPERI